MIRVEDSVVIARPIAEVWAFMSDLDHADKWGLWGKATKTSDGPVGVGTTYRSYEKGLTADLKTSEWDPPNRMTFWSAIFPSRRFGPLRPATLTFALESLDDSSTRVSRQAGGETHGAWKILDRLIAAGIKGEREEDAVKRLSNHTLGSGDGDPSGTNEMPMPIGQELQAPRRRMMRKATGINARLPTLRHPPCPISASPAIGCPTADRRLAGAGRHVTRT
jgi:hypothetical protein